MHAAGSDDWRERTDTHIRIYQCDECHHEMHLTVWGKRH